MKLSSLFFSIYTSISVSIEIPGGLVDKGETVEEAAVRELGEETGRLGSVEVRSVPALVLLSFLLPFFLSFFL